MNSLPAILIGGPPHAGKSVLFYSLTHALRERHIPHHAIRACLDGEGNWSQESHPDTVNQIRLPVKTTWPPSFVERILQSIEHRCLPFLIDIGGRPRGNQMQLFHGATHAILLKKDDESDDTLLWQRYIWEHGVTMVAQLTSILEGEARVTRQSPILEGSIIGLERHRIDRVHGPAFELLVEHVAKLFASYTPQDLERVYFERAPGELINLSTFIAPETRWRTEMLPFLLTQLPTRIPLALYGVAPNWVYAAVAAATYQQPLYQFDPALPFGWVQPLAVETSAEQHSDAQTALYRDSDFTTLKIQIPNTRLEYFQVEPFPLPYVPSEQGLVIDGRIPYWLLTAIIRHYRDQGHPWLATYYAPLSQAIIVYTRIDKYRPGDQLLK